MSDADMHEMMEKAYAEQLTGQAASDLKRRPHHYQVRLPPDLSAKLRSYMASKSLNANQALQHIITTFFH
jgi:hypothetical protein